MKDIALQALDAVSQPALTYADARVMEIRDRQVSTKNGKTGHVSSGVSMGLAIRVLAARLLGFRRHRRSLAQWHPRRRRTGSRNRARRHPGQEARRLAGARREVRSHLGLAHPDRSIHHPGRPQRGPAARYRPRTAPQSGRHPGRMRHELRAPPPGLRLLARQPDRSDPLPERRRLCRAGLQRRRDPEALVSQFVRRPASAQGLRIDRRVGPGGQRRAYRRRSRGAALAPISARRASST